MPPYVRHAVLLIVKRRSYGVVAPALPHTVGGRRTSPCFLGRGCDEGKEVSSCSSSATRYMCALPLYTDEIIEGLRDSCVHAYGKARERAPDQVSLLQAEARCLHLHAGSTILGMCYRASQPHARYAHLLFVLRHRSASSKQRGPQPCGGSSTACSPDACNRARK
ncbi:hypothetical protein FKP32DRAFT_930284 [Trametes sanguinea]|nr:hypothetical protein FKP32DRAFT_930284 [Trametes sanguinea]